MKAVVFDMDGILFDTERLWMDGWSEIAKKNGLPNMEEVAKQCIGLNGADTKQTVLNHCGEDFQYDVFSSQIGRWVKDTIQRKGLPMKLGVNKILAYLKQSGTPIGLASSSKYSSIISHLKEANIIDYFDVIVAGDMIEHSKPKPDIYILACNKLGVDPKDTYAIEDSPNGIRSAHAAGMRPIMVPDLVKPDAEMEELSYLICKDLMEVMQFFNH